MGRAQPDGKEVGAYRFLIEAHILFSHPLGQPVFLVATLHRSQIEVVELRFVILFGFKPAFSKLLDLP